MNQNKKPFSKNSLSNFFPSSGPGLRQKKEKPQNTINKSTTEKSLENRVSVTKAVYATHTQEISFEKFLKSKQKKS